MKYQDLVTEIANDTGLSRKDVDKVIDHLTNNISEALANRDAVRIPRLGTFDTKHRQARETRNPRTGETMMTQDKHVPAFRPATDLKDRVK